MRPPWMTTRRLMIVAAVVSLAARDEITNVYIYKLYILKYI